MRSSTTNATNAPSGNRNGRPNLGRAARRGIRQAARLANELNLHSFRIHVDGSVTWIRKLENPPSQPESRDEGARSQPSEQSKRKQRGRERAIAHHALQEKARAFRVRSILNSWRRLAASPPSPLPLQPPPPPPPLPEPEAWPALPQRQEHMDDERASKRAHESPAAGALSPAPRAATKTQRALVLPGQPPPSNPPSPPTPTPTPPPSPGRDVQVAALPVAQGSSSRTATRAPELDERVKRFKRDFPCREAFLAHWECRDGGCDVCAERPRFEFIKRFMQGEPLADVWAKP